jgi:hypothetical protein
MNIVSDWRSVDDRGVAVLSAAKTRMVPSRSDNRRVRGSRVIAVGLAGILAVLALAACGTPDDGSGEKFVFTPVQYVTVQPPGGLLTTIVLDERECPDYAADIVTVTVAKDQREDFVRWVDAVDSPQFEIMQWLPDHPELDHDFLFAHVRVPAGSVNDARSFVHGRPGVRAVERNWFRFIPEDPCAG